MCVAFLDCVLIPGDPLLILTSKYLIFKNRINTIFFDRDDFVQS